VTETGRARGAVTVWITTPLERKCIAGLLAVSFDYGLLITVCSFLFMLIDYPGLAISPWYRLVLGFFLAIFSECNLLCSFAFQFGHIILFISSCFILFVFLYFYFIISSKMQLVKRVGVLFLR